MDRIHELKEKLENLFITRGIHLEFDKNESKRHRDKVPKQAPHRRRCCHCNIFGWVRSKLRKASNMFPKKSSFTKFQYLKRGFQILKYIVTPQKQIIVEDKIESDKRIFIGNDWRYDVIGGQMCFRKKKKFDLFRQFVSMISNNRDYDFELESWQFYFLLVLNETNISYYIPIFQRLHGVGTFWTTLYLLLTTIFLQMPFFTVFVTMCSYSKSSYIKFFEAIPLLIGIPVALTVLHILTGIASINYILAGFFLLSKVISGSVWRECHYGFFDGKCKNTSMEIKAVGDCKKNIYATQIFLKEELRFYKHTNSFYVEILLMCLVATTYIVSLLGFKKMKNILTKTGLVCLIVCGIIMSIFCLTNFYDVSTLMPLQSFQFEDNLQDFFYSLIINPQSLTTLMWISTMKPFYLEPQKVAVRICFYKCVCIFLMSSFASISRCGILVYYNLQKLDCFKFEELDIIFTVLTDMYIRYEYGSIYVILWLGCLTACLFIIFLITNFVFADSLLQAFAKHKRKSILTITLYLVLLFSVATINIAHDLQIEFQYWISTTLILTNNVHLALISFGIYFLYTPHRFFEEYLFTYGYSPRKDWYTQIAAISFFGTIICILSAFRAYHWIINSNSNTQLFYCVFSLILIAITYTILITKIIILNFNNKMSQITDVHPNWGPHNPKVRHLRRLYFYHRDVRHRREAPACIHKCLLLSNVYRNVKHHQFLSLESTHHSQIFEKYTIIQPTKDDDDLR